MIVYVHAKGNIITYSHAEWEHDNIFPCWGNITYSHAEGEHDCICHAKGNMITYSHAEWDIITYSHAEGVT